MFSKIKTVCIETLNIEYFLKYEYGSRVSFTAEARIRTSNKFDGNRARWLYLTISLQIQTSVSQVE